MGMDVMASVPCQKRLWDGKKRGEKCSKYRINTQIFLDGLFKVAKMCFASAHVHRSTLLSFPHLFSCCFSKLGVS